MKNDIFINGYALDCALGASPEEVSRQLFSENPEVSVREHEIFKMPFFTMAEYDKKEYIHFRSFLHCFNAVRSALKMAFPRTGVPPGTLRVGCVAGTTGDVQFGDLDFYKALKEQKVTDDRIYHFVHGTIAERIVQGYCFSGPAITISNTCVSGADAVLVGAQYLEADICDVVIVLGIDLISLMCLTGFYTLGAASEKRCTPFDTNRSGMNVGEGCGCVILRKGSLDEKYEKTFSKPEFRFSGGGSAGDAYHLTAPHPEGKGLRLAIEKAFAMSGKRAEDIAFINAHGTGTPANDASETNAINALFGKNVPFFSTKGLTGHTLGASGILELIFTMLCLKEQKIPASYGCTEPAGDLPAVPNMQLRSITGNTAMSTSLAFGGCNTALIVERIEENALD